MRPGKTTQIGISIPTALKLPLEKQADVERRSLSNMTAILIEEGLLRRQAGKEEG